MNLKGFCGADPTACGYRPSGPTAGPCPPGSHAQPCATGETFDTVSGCCYPLSIEQAKSSPYGAAIEGFLYRMIAFVGCRGVCPALPLLGQTAGEILGLPATMTVAGVGIDISTTIIGRLVGEFLQKELCSTCQ